MTKLGIYFKAGVAQYGDLRAAGGEVSPEILAVFLYGKMDKWNPRVRGRILLDDDTKLAACQMLGGLIINMAREPAA